MLSHSEFILKATLVNCLRFNKSNPTHRISVISSTKESRFEIQVTLNQAANKHIFWLRQYKKRKCELRLLFWIEFKWVASGKKKIINHTGKMQCDPIPLALITESVGHKDKLSVKMVSLCQISICYNVHLKCNNSVSYKFT